MIPTPLVRPDAKIVMVVVDGLGGFADASGGSELEEADTPNLDRLAAEGIVGLVEPVGPGVTPGSGPGHLALFGYDPVADLVERGALAAAGVGVELRPGDVAARGNFAILADDGTIADRRAGRMADEAARALVARLNDELGLAGVEIHHVKQHRVAVVLRAADGDGHDPDLTGNDPGRSGATPIDPVAHSPGAEPTAALVRRVLARVGELLGPADTPVGTILLRGFDGHRDLPSLEERFGLRGAAVAAYPMYRGVASLVGMDVLRRPTSLDDACAVVAGAWDDHDFFFVHDKAADEAGEDGDRAGKERAIEAVDAIVARLRDLGPAVLAVTGDHATPSQLAAHSWHPVPTVVWNGIERDEQTRFGERWCRAGALGLRPTNHLLAIMVAMADRFEKYGG
ncbi:MAG: phosphoglycerate mutase [Actinomycetota bacterium]|nr:phosphoglycerate mutase [Actinomycetota bacterium]